MSWCYFVWVYLFGTLWASWNCAKTPEIRKSSQWIFLLPTILSLSIFSLSGIPIFKDYCIWWLVRYHIEGLLQFLLFSYIWDIFSLTVSHSFCLLILLIFITMYLGAVLFELICLAFFGPLESMQDSSREQESSQCFFLLPTALSLSFS